MKKRILSLALCLSMVLALLPQTVIFASAAASGTCGENLTWKLDGAMTNWNSSAPWYSNRSSIKSVVIEDGVTTIGDWAFVYCDSLTSVEIPESVTSIGNYAFYDCRSLTMVEIPSGVTTIGNGAFCSCGKLAAVEIPESVTSIGDKAFFF